MALEQNELTGTIPDWIGELTSMKFMALGGNKFSGSIPSALTSLTKLSELSLEDNKMTGDLSVIEKIPTLTRLFLGDNQFEGRIDHYFLLDMPNLKQLDLSSNSVSSILCKSFFFKFIHIFVVLTVMISFPSQFTGVIPHHFFTYEILDVHDNDLEGEIPAIEVDTYPIKYMLLHNNGFSGRMHNSIANLKYLTRLDVSNNELTGAIPYSIADMEQLEYLYLANNGFENGPIPVWRNLTNLKELSLRGTNRRGTIEPWIGNDLRGLTLLSLDNNNLSGEIPKEFGHLEQMEFLLLNQNNLEGTVPDTMKHLHYLSKSHFSYSFRPSNYSCTNADHIFCFLVFIEMLRIDDNQIEGNADPVCADQPPKLDIFTSDCGSGGFECPCCSNCCDDPNSSCNDEDKVPENDISWKHGYPKSQRIFSEDLVFENLGNRRS
jgi:Leucine-rich repeat (LRR) protein